VNSEQVGLKSPAEAGERLEEAGVKEEVMSFTFFVK